MSIEGVRSMFLGFYEKRLRLQLLDAELAAIEESARGSFMVEPYIDSQYSLVTFSTQIVESILADTYPLTMGSPTLLATLRQLRQQLIVANNKVQVFFSAGALPLTNHGDLVRQHNLFMSNKCDTIVALVQQARTALKPLIA